jgi:hypothetical protein
MTVQRAQGIPASHCRRERDARLGYRRRASALTALPLIVLTAALLSSCGGSSGGARGSVKTTLGLPAHLAASVSAFRACLQKHGVTLSRPESGENGIEARIHGGRGASGRSQLPHGVTRAELESARKKCGEGGGLSNLGGDKPSARSGSSPTTARQQSVARFTECMRANGVRLPASGASAAGQLLSARGINTNSKAFKAAEEKCIRELVPGAALGQ